MYKTDDKLRKINFHLNSKDKDKKYNRISIVTSDFERRLNKT